MTDIVPTLFAVVAAGLMLFALVLMARGNLMLAGLSFLGASLAIYFRETRE